MAKAFAKQVTLTAATATSVDAALTAAGYTGSRIGKYMKIETALADLFRGADSSLTAGNGMAVTSTLPFTRDAQDPKLSIDPTNTWLISTGGGAVGLTFESF